MRFLNRPLTPDLRARLAKHPKGYSQFATTLPVTMMLLSDECRKIIYPDHKREVVLMLDVHDWEIRQDGQLRATAKVGPDVALAIDTKKGPIIFPSGSYLSYEDNLRAIALTLQALRAIDRWGVTSSGEQYTGFSALGSGRPMGRPEPMDRQQARRILADAASLPLNLVDTLDLRQVYRRAVRAMHPDTGGSEEAFKLVDEAYRVLVGS